MSVSHGSSADIMGNGYSLSEFLNSASFSSSRDTGETTTFKNKSKTYIPGLKDTTMSCEGIYDGDADAVDAILHAALETDASGLFSYMPEGMEAFNRLAFSLDTIETSYEINTDIGDVAQVTAELTAGDQGRFTRGRVVHPLSLENADGMTVSLDGGVATAKGASLVVHATTSANLTLTLQDSADNATFADLPGEMIFTIGRGSQRLVIPGAIRRWTRVTWVGTGTFLAIVDRF